MRLFLFDIQNMWIFFDYLTDTFIWFSWIILFTLHLPEMIGNYPLLKLILDCEYIIRTYIKYLFFKAVLNAFDWQDHLKDHHLAKENKLISYSNGNFNRDEWRASTTSALTHTQVILQLAHKNDNHWCITCTIDFLPMEGIIGIA